ncbi:hypothetical protein ACE4Z6_27240, partial [Salmonella enterica]|uniref:hypothetical protein n=1 Tax=Salmonella enterica TaxID=28901 RepID=UPI003D28C3E1
MGGMAGMGGFPGGHSARPKIHHKAEKGKDSQKKGHPSSSPAKKSKEADKKKENKPTNKKAAYKEDAKSSGAKSSAP